MEHLVRFESGFDCIKFECIHGSPKCKPGSGGSHGKHGLTIRFIVKGDDGAVQFVLYTGWLPQYAPKNDIGFRHVNPWGILVLPADLGYHSKTPHYEGQTVTDEHCEFCDGEQCYYDGSGLNCNDAMYSLVNGGEKALWGFLDAYYVFVFQDGEYPVPAEYPMPLRDGA